MTVPNTDENPDNRKFYDATLQRWRELAVQEGSGFAPVDVKELEKDAKKTRDELKAFLLSSLQMQNIVILAGSGTSLGKAVNGPSMWNLWDWCVNTNSNSDESKRILSEAAAKVISEICYKIETDHENIETLLSRCEAYTQIKESADVTAFLIESKKVILAKCSGFIDKDNTDQLAAHSTFLHRLSRRRVRDSRLKLFTTNYDLCFETAAGRLGLVAIDGFSFSQPRFFDPRFFLYDIVRRPNSGDGLGTPLEGVFQLYKLHGSVDWSRESHSSIEINSKPTPEKASLIYPAKGKYQQSFMQPHLELISQYFSALREPNTCVIVVGFGFNDDHLSEPILAAIRTNPHLRLIVVGRSAESDTNDNGKNSYWKSLLELAKRGEDVCLINMNFAEFAEVIPDLKSLTPAEQLAKAIKRSTDKND